MRTMYLIAVLFLLGQCAAQAEKCDLTMKDVDSHLPSGVSIKPLTKKSFYFLEGIWATNPTTPPGLPPTSDRAYLLDDEGNGIIVFANGKGETACAYTMLAPKTLLKLIDEIERGPGDAS